MTNFLSPNYSSKLVIMQLSSRKQPIEYSEFKIRIRPHWILCFGEKLAWEPLRPPILSAINLLLTGRKIIAHHLLINRSIVFSC